MKKVKTSHKGRKCKFPHCSQILSIYNHSEYCYIHLGLVYFKKEARCAKIA
ncbi:MAG: hypothetical protein KJ818_00895 [Candidatus Omnitrophica bacterium]|nr:hypothetical protein [Candidatus Omnitrophota bacterium]